MPCTDSYYALQKMSVAIVNMHTLYVNLRAGVACALCSCTNLT